MTSAIVARNPKPDQVAPAPAPAPVGKVPGLVLVVLGVLAALALKEFVAGLPMLVAAVLIGGLIGNSGGARQATHAGLSYASTTILRAGIVLLGLRLSLGDVSALGVRTLVVIVATVSLTFFSVQFLGQRLGLSRGLSVLVASGFSICGNSAIASVKGVTDTEEEEVAAAVGLVTLCGTAAIFVLPALGTLFGLSDMQLGVWTGASVQDTAQVIAVASAAGPTVLAVATAVKLTRVLFLAPIVAGLSIWNRRTDVGEATAGGRPPLLPLFVLGFLAMLLVRSSGVLPGSVLDSARSIDQLALAAGMVGLGSSVRLGRLRRLGFRPLVLGVVAWGVVAGMSLAAIHALGV